MVSHVPVAPVRHQGCPAPGFPPATRIRSTSLDEEITLLYDV